MYELISIPKRNTTAAGVTHFICSFLVLISHQTPAIIDGVGYKYDWCTWQSARSRGRSPPWNLYSDLMIFMNPGRGGHPGPTGRL
ncbi:MAG: hypothetical protein WA446_07760, partial [Steroidobacteraceae bacterium]